MQLIFVNYDIYQRPEVPPQVQNELKANALPASRLKQDMGAEVLTWFDMVKDTYPVTIQKMFEAIKQKPAQIVCEICQMKGPKAFTARLNPSSASVLGAPYDVEVQLSPTTPASPMLKPGVVVTVTGQFMAMDSNYLITF